MENSIKNTVENSKIIRLVDYLIRVASLRSKLVRDVAEYHSVLWVKDIPRQKGCFTQAWGRAEDFDSDVWIELQNQREPELPKIPSSCEEWIMKISLRNKSDIPELLEEITRQVENPAWQEGSDQPEFIALPERLEDHPEIVSEWDRYVEKLWLPWAEVRWFNRNGHYAKSSNLRREVSDE